MYGKLEGMKDRRYQCCGYELHMENIRTYYEPNPTSAPSFSPSEVPTFMEMEMGAKGKSNYARGLRLNNMMSKLHHNICLSLRFSLGSKWKEMVTSSPLIIEP
jgi:hypothetical protein